MTKIQVKTVDTDVMTMEETDEFVEQHLGRKITIIGACIESDAHTVGIDAIMNMKGYAGHYGLERYEMFEALNMGSQVPVVRKYPGAARRREPGHRTTPARDQRNPEISVETGRQSRQTPLTRNPLSLQHHSALRTRDTNIFYQ